MAQNELMDPADRARRAYELGRLRAALRVALYVAPMTILSLVGCARPGLNAVMGIALLALAVGLLWRGQAYARAASAGLVAGAAPLLIPMFVRSSGHCCIGGACWMVCMEACIGGGFIAGGIIGFRAMSQRTSRGGFFVAALVVAALAGSLGCVTGGLAGVLGMAAGMLVSGAPLVIGARLRRT
jgi:hypothetical protein